MKDKFLYGLIPALILIIVALSLGCLIAPLDAQDATPTAEYLEMSQYGYMGLPKAQVTFPTRLEAMCRKDGVWCIGTLTNVELKGWITDWSAAETHVFYISDQGCYELVYSKSGSFGDDGYPHPDRGAWWVTC